MKIKEKLKKLSKYVNKYKQIFIYVIIPKIKKKNYNYIHQ